MTEALADFLAVLAAPRRAPGGIAATAAGAAMGLALMERTLAHPPADAEPEEVTQATQAGEILRALRKRMLNVVAADLAAVDALDAALADEGPDADAKQAGARLPAYRAARRLMDCVIQGLTLMLPALDVGSRVALADLEAAWRLLDAALEAAIAACEQHLNGLSSFFAEGERPALDEQARQGREWVEQASAQMGWRLGGKRQAEVDPEDDARPWWRET